MTAYISVWAYNLLNRYSFFFQESFLALEIFLINVSLCLNDFFCLFVLVCSAVVRPAILQLQPPQPFCVEFPCTPSGCMGSLHSATVQNCYATQNWTTSFHQCPFSATNVAPLRRCSHVLFGSAWTQDYKIFSPQLEKKKLNCHS